MKINTVSAPGAHYLVEDVEIENIACPWVHHIKWQGPIRLWSMKIKTLSDPGAHPLVEDVESGWGPIRLSARGPSSYEA